MPPKFIAAVLLLAGGAAGQTPAPKQRAGLEAQLMSMGRSEGAVRSLTATVQLTNNSPDNVYVLLLGRPSAVDDAGDVFNETEAVSGVTYCPGIQNPPSKTVCVGRPADPRFPVPVVDSYTEIEPGKSVTFSIAMRATHGSRGAKVFLTQEIAYRRVKENGLEKDASLPEQQKLKAVRLGSISFNAAPTGPQKEIITSTINFARVE